LRPRATAAAPLPGRRQPSKIEGQQARCEFGVSRTPPGPAAADQCGRHRTRQL